MRTPRLIKNQPTDTEDDARATVHARTPPQHPNTPDHILEAPHPNFDVLKQVYPCYIHGRDLAGNPISVEQPGACVFFPPFSLLPYLTR